MKGKVIIAANTAWSVYNFRAGLIRTLTTEGYEVVVVAPTDEYAIRLPELGCRFVPLAIDNKGTHVGRDLVLLLRFFSFLRKERPDVYIGYTIKPNIYGSVAAHILRIPVINNISGLGTVFIKENWLTNLVRWLYRAALSHSHCVFFLNDEDLELFVKAGLVAPEKVARLPGEGIDLRAFQPVPEVSENGQSFRFLLSARMLRDKGIVEYVEAARVVRKRYPNAEFNLLGFLDVQNPTAISTEQMATWVEEGIISYLGVTDDVKPYLAEADCVVLPSYYREGIPRSLLEAAAMGKPIITTDAVGCRDVVDDGVNGFLCLPKSKDDLAEKMEKMILLDHQRRFEMGKRGRQKVEREFDEKIVIGHYLSMIKGAKESAGKS
ncbi:MAG: glycosyltransferase family 4 protein [Methylobacter sp.]